MFGFNMFPEPLRPFNTLYRCYSISMLPGNVIRTDVDKGGKIILPPSALDHLTRLNIQYPMLFKLTNVKTNRITHSGVLEFVAEEGKVFLPYWMMRNLLLDEGSMIRVESTALPVATFSKFQPQSVEFLDISNPKAVLENALRSFSCLTAGDVIAIDYNNRLYELCVLETKPGDAVSITECDLNVDFAAPVGYKDPNQVNDDDALEVDGSSTTGDSLFEDLEDSLDEKPKFPGGGFRLDGKAAVVTSSPNGSVTESHSPSSSVKGSSRRRGIPDYSHKRGTIRFIRTIKPPSMNNGVKDCETSSFQAFQGSGQSLFKKHNKKQWKSSISISPWMS